jgi:hypothetical protein
VDARSDVFSFCASLYEALYGVKPFRARRVVDLERAIRDGDLAAPSALAADVEPWLRQVVVRGLAADPAGRYASMHDLLDALRAPPRRAKASLVAVTVIAVGATVGSLLLFRSPKVESAVAAAAVIPAPSASAGQPSESAPAAAEPEPSPKPPPPSSATPVVSVEPTVAVSSPKKALPRPPVRRVPSPTSQTPPSPSASSPEPSKESNDLARTRHD